MNELIDTKNYRDLSVFECGREECVKDKEISLTKKRYHLFHYVYSGKGTLILNKKEYHIARNTIFFIPRESDAVYYPDRDNPWHYMWIGFDGDKVDNLLEELSIDVDHPLINDPQKLLRTHFDRVISHFNRSGRLDIYAIGSIYQLFGEMFYLQEGPIVGNAVKISVQLAKEYIQNNYQFDISVIDIARNANVTPNYLSTIFRHEEGMSTKQYLTKVRMKKALTYLIEGNYSVKEVAKMVGYPNQLHFSTEFKKYYGNSPLHYMKEGIKK